MDLNDIVIESTFGGGMQPEPFIFHNIDLIDVLI